MNFIPIANGMNNALWDDFRFDDWMALAQEDMAGFERARRELLKLCAEQSCEPGVAFLLQCKLDMCRITSSSPYAAACLLASACANLRHDLNRLTLEIERLADL